MLKREPLAKKIFVLGVDGMDPRLTRKYLDEGKMPNVAKLMEKGSCREDLVMLGGNPTVTPPMWTTLSTGATPMTHGITGFFRQSPDALDVLQYNMDSRFCKAEQLWNVFAEAGHKTLVWHWPGSSWPPTSDNPNLCVVDGTQPGGVNMGTGQVEEEFLVGASVEVENVTFLQDFAGDVSAPCCITDLAPSTEVGFDKEAVMHGGNSSIIVLQDGEGSRTLKLPLSVAKSWVKPASNWADAPKDAKEFVIPLSQGLIRRPCLILKNEDGIYDTVAIYKSKKDTEPLVEIKKGKIYTYIDESLKNDVRYEVIRELRLLELAEDGTQLKIWVSPANNIHENTVWHPKSLYDTVVKNVGYPVPCTMIGQHEIDLINECRLASWYVTADWQSGALNYLMENEGFDVVFSHFHNVDNQMHKIVRSLHDHGRNEHPESVYEQFVEDVYVQTDYYIGKFLHLLDEGWTIMLLSDHGLACPEYDANYMGDCNAISVRMMEELGFTVMKKDENGNDIKEIDWEHTKALATRENDIWINLKGRDKHTLSDGTVIDGIVDPADKYELEEEIMTALYGYKSPESGNRTIALAIRNRDAALLGMGGPESGDIIVFNAEGYHYDHADGLSTVLGMKDTSLSPIFIGAGPGFKENFRAERHLRELDVAPTMAILGGVRMPHQCEGAPMYEILSEEI